MDDIFTTRRSVRRFKDSAVEEDKMEALYEVAQWAPSWGNKQCVELIVVKDVGVKQNLSALLSAKNPATKSVERAPVIIAVCGVPEKSGYYKSEQVTRYAHWFLYDLGIVTQNICLKAHELGLGTVIVGSFEHDQVEKLLGVPAHCELVSLLALGYPDHEPPAPKRKPTSEFVHIERFGNSVP